MARTECTQAQWMAVMGNNPSNFKGDDYPVETVSWDDVHRFITKFNKAKTLPEAGRPPYPPRRSGSMPAAPERRQPIVLGIHSMPSRRTSTRHWGRRAPSPVTRRMLGVCMTCTATCLNGARIGMGRNSLAALTRRGWLRARSGCAGAAVGTMKRTAAAPQPAATATRPPNTDSEGSVLLSVQSVRTADSGNFFSTPISPPSGPAWAGVAQRSLATGSSNGLHPQSKSLAVIFHGLALSMHRHRAQTSRAC